MRLHKKIQYQIDKNGWGLWAVEEKLSGRFVGFVGLNQPKTELPFTPCIEVVWRLAKAYWGKGYATEAGRKSLEYAFRDLSLDEVVSFTAVINKRSEAVMQRLGMINSHKNFDHPQVSSNSPLSEHLLYKIALEPWRKLKERKQVNIAL